MQKTTKELVGQALIDQSWFIECLQNNKLIDQLKKIRFIVCDIDGTVTNGGVYYNGRDEMRRYSPVNGYAVVYAQKHDLKIGFLSGNQGPSIVQRAERLNVPLSLCELGHDDSKKEAFKRLLKKANVNKEEALMFGDDALDYGVKSEAGLFVSLVSAMFYIQSNADLVVPRSGGNHALRLLLDLILYVQKKHFMQDVLDRQFSNV